MAHKKKMTLVRVNPDLVQACNIAAAAKGIKPWELYEKIIVDYLREKEPEIWRMIQVQFDKATE